MKSIATKTDTVDTLPANAWNSLSDENQNAVTKSGQTLDATSETTPDPNPTQLARAITKAAQEARAYSDSGAANAYVLTAVGSWQQPTAYTNGMTVEFIGANANTGASTVNVAGLGVKNITTINGSIINSGDIGPTILTRIRYSTSSGSFLLEQVGSSNSEVGGGALNLNINPNANISIDNSGVNDVGDYIDSGSGTTASKTITDSEIPLYPRITTGIKITLASGTNDYTRLRFRVPEAFRRNVLTLSWFQKISGLSLQDMKFELYRYSDAYVTGEEEVGLSSDISGESYISIADRYINAVFTPNTYEYYELRFINNGGTSGYLSLNEVSIALESSKEGIIISEWVEETASINDWDNTTGLTLNTGYLRWKQDTSDIIVKGHYRFSGSGSSSGEFLFNFGNILNSLTINQTANEFYNSATGLSLNNLAGYPLGVDIRASTKKLAFYTTGGTVRVGTNISDSVSGELTYIGFEVRLRITEWKETGVSRNISSAQRQNTKVIATSNNGQAVSNPSDIIYEDAVLDTYGAYNNSTGVFTPPIKGTYRVTAKATGNAISVRAAISINRNGAGYAIELYGNTNTESLVIGDFDLDVVDLLKIVNTSGSGNLLNDTTFNRLSISLVAVNTGVGAGLPIPTGIIRLDSGNGHGATNTNIRRLSNITKQAGTEFTYSDSANDGGSITVNEDCFAIISYTDSYSASTCLIGITKNASGADLTTSISSIAASKKLAMVQPGSNAYGNVCVAANLKRGDIIRPHTDGNPDNSTNNVQFSIIAVNTLGR